jgi:hypothetical protein
MLLNELRVLLDPSSGYTYPARGGAGSSNYWVGGESTDTGLYFESNAGLMRISTESTDLIGNVDATPRIGTFGTVAGGNTGWPVTLGSIQDWSGLDRQVTLLETQGEQPIPNLEVDRNGFTVVIRGSRMNQLSSAYMDARLKLDEIKTTFHGLVGATSGGVRYPGIMALETPRYRGTDSNERPVFSCDFKVWRESTN